MTAFAVIRHTETGGIGTATEAAMPIHRANGWIRVSDYRDAPSAFHLPDFADAPDLDAEPEPVEPETKSKKPAKKSDEESNT